MSVQAIVWVLEHSRAKATHRCVMIAIANHIDADSGEGWSYVERVLEEANCSEDSYRRAVDVLVADGELEVDVRAGGRPKMRDAYRPNLFRFPKYRATIDPDRLRRADRSRPIRPPQPAEDSAATSPPQSAEDRPSQSAGHRPSQLAEVRPLQSARVPIEEPSREPSKDPSPSTEPFGALPLRAPTEAQAEDLSTIVDTRAAQLVALLATRLDPSTLAERLYDPRDVGCRVHLGRRLVELERDGWPDERLAVELAGAVYKPGEIASVAGLLLHRARLLAPVVDIDFDAPPWWEAATAPRAPGPSSAALVAAAEHHGRNLLHAGIAIDDIAYELVDQYRGTHDQLVAALTGAGLLEHGEPTALVASIDVHTRELLDLTLARGVA